MSRSLLVAVAVTGAVACSGAPEADSGEAASAQEIDPNALEGKCTVDASSMTCDLRDLLGAQVNGQHYEQETGGLSFEHKTDVTIREVIDAGLTLAGPEAGDEVTVRAKVRAWVRASAGYCYKRPTLAIHSEMRRHCDWGQVFNDELNIDAKVVIGKDCKTKLATAHKTGASADWDTLLLDALWKPVLQGLAEKSMRESAAKQASKLLGREICEPPPVHAPCGARPHGSTWKKREEGTSCQMRSYSCKDGVEVAGGISTIPRCIER